MNYDDINWRSPGEMMEFLIREAPEKFSAILLVESEAGFCTIAVFGESGTMWEDAPLSAFTCPDFNASNYKRLAIVAIQED